MTNLLTIQLPDVDPSEAASVLARLVGGVGALWDAGRFRTLIDSPEGKAAVAAFESAHLDAQAQLTAAMANGDSSVTIAVRLPASAARGAVTFVRAVIAMLSTPETAAMANVEPLNEAEVQYMDRHLRPVEAAIATHELSRRP